MDKIHDQDALTSFIIIYITTNFLFDKLDANNNIC